MIHLVDSGILLRLVEPSDPHHKAIDDSVMRLFARGDRLVASTQNFAEFWNVCTRPKTARGGLGLTIPETERRLQILERLILVLAEHAGTYSIWRRLVVQYRVSGRQVHDARLAALMLAHGLTHILTLNGADFARYPAITVVDPCMP